jgi:excinuclease UvrABC ATPase subunit
MRCRGGQCHPKPKRKASLVTAGERGARVSEVIKRLLENNLADLDSVRVHNLIPIGSSGGHEISLAPYGHTVLVCGQSGSGKSSFVMSLLEQIVDRKYQLSWWIPKATMRISPAAERWGLKSTRRIYRK